ncbi:MAG: hypothetical protein M3Y48_15015 [Actinomycetota bacterium]|nr:hypothetical protein [Actinomycetota bacterium]
MVEVERVSREVPHEALDNALDDLTSLITGHAHVIIRARLHHSPVIKLPRTASVA